MDVHAVLAGGLADVNADVVPIGLMLLLNQALRFIQQRKDGALLRGRHVEEVGHVPARDDDDMTGSQRVIVQSRISQLVLGDEVLRLAQPAIG